MRHLLCYVLIFLASLPSKTFGQSSGIPIPPPIKADNANPNNCYNINVNLVVPNGAAYLTQVANSYYVWEYTNNVPTNTSIYSILGTSATSNFTLFPITAFGGTQISTSTSKYIRVRLAAGNINNPTTLGTSLTIPLVFSPSAPYFTGSGIEVLTTRPSCSNSPTGSIIIPHMRFTDTILYIVKNSSDGVYCNPITNNPPCFNVVKSGKTADMNYEITGLPPGHYNVFISNIGGNNGTCNNVSIANIDVLPPVQIAAENTYQPTCYNDNNGKFVLDVIGGDSNTYRYSISPNVGTKTYFNGKISFENLPQGNYTTFFTDTCGTILSRSFSLIHPPKVVGDVIKVVPNCANPGNGLVKITARYNFNAAGYNRFNYKLFKNGLCTDSLMNTLDTTFTITGLTGASYRAVAYSPNTPNCVGIDETFILPFNPLTISIDSVKQIDCNGQTNGYIKVKSTGGSNSYLYYLRNNATGVLVIDSFGIFQNLAPATYTAIAKN